MPAHAPRIHVTAVVVTRGERVALVRKRGTAAWIFPGGKPEAGEDAASCGARELAEELGVVVAPAVLRRLGRVVTEAANEPGHVLVADVVELPAGEVAEQARPAAEIAELRWHALDADGADLAPLTRVVLGRLRDRSRSARDH